MESVVSAPARIGLVDDDHDFLDLTKKHLRGKGVPVEVTGSSEESLRWAQNGQIDILVLDMRMPEPGLQLAERILNVNKDVEVVLVTGFDPSEEETQWARRLGILIYHKPDPDDWIDYLAQARRSPDAREARRARRLVRIHQYVHEEWTKDLMSKLKEIPDLKEAVISSAEGSFTVADLIEDIKNVTPRGIKYIELWQRTMGTLLKLRERR